MHDLHVQHIDRHDRRDDRRGDDGRRCTTREILRSATRAGPRGALGQRAQDDSAARRRGQGDRRGFLGSGVWQRVGAVAIDLRSGGAPLRGAQLRSVGPARQQSSLRSARRRSSGRRQLLSPRDDQVGVRGGGRERRHARGLAQVPVHDGAPRCRRTSDGDPVLDVFRDAARARRASSRGGSGARR